MWPGSLIIITSIETFILASGLCIWPCGSRFTSCAHPRAPPCSLVLSLLLEENDNAAYGSIAGVATPGSLPPSFHSIQFRSASGYRARARAHTHIHTYIYVYRCIRAYRHVHRRTCARVHDSACFRTQESVVALRWALASPHRNSLGSLTLCDESMGLAPLFCLPRLYAPYQWVVGEFASFGSFRVGIVTSDSWQERSPHLFLAVVFEKCSGRQVMKINCIRRIYLVLFFLVVKSVFEWLGWVE